MQVTGIPDGKGGFRTNNEKGAPDFLGVYLLAKIPVLFAIEIKSTTQSVDIYGYPLDSEKLKKMMSQAYTAYMEDKRRRDVFLVVQHLKSEKHFKLYLFNLTRDFDLSSHSNPFNHSENKWPWNGKEKIYVNKLSSEKLNKQVYKLMPSQAQIIYDNTYEMEQKI